MPSISHTNSRNFVVLTSCHRYFRYIIMMKNLSLRHLRAFLFALTITFAQLVALSYQLFNNELPCPLCLLQRLGLFIFVCGAIAQLKHEKFLPRYDILMICGCVYTMMVSLRQVLLHIQAGDLGYGSALFGLHFYTWNTILCFFLLLALAFPNIHSLFKISPRFITKNVNKILISILIIALTNIVLIYMECGFYQCPDNPENYINKFV